MKPRYNEMSYETSRILEKAKAINDRMNNITKAKCDCKGDCDCKDCPKCGSKMNKMGCMKMGCGKMEKAAIEDPKPVPKEKITDINPHFVAESGGQTKSGYYTSNGNTIEYEDNPKRAKDDKKVDLGKLGGRMNPHAGTGVEREDSAGGEVKKANPKASLREDAEQGAPVACKTCGGTPRTGCGLHDGMDVFACNQFSPL
tara:strand:+ start:1598 stop:2197 length:600 start_codon:yes stop_codon:yes gene_type:complete